MIKKLNLWGHDLDKIDIIEKMINLEVLSLSLNKIKSLKPFKHLYNLRELFLRRNEIKDLS